MTSHPYLLRDDAPLTEAQWDSIDRAVAEAARSALVARRFVPLFGPLGAGTQTVQDDIFTGPEPGRISLLGSEEEDIVRPAQRRTITLPTIFKDFMIPWRDIESSRQYEQPLDTGVAAAAAIACARAEDRLVLHGDEELGHDGLLTVEGATEAALGDWATTGQAFDDIVNATQALVEAGFPGPYAVALHPRRYALLNRVHSESGVLEIEQIQKLAAAGVYRSPELPDGVVLVLSSGAHNADLVLGQDIVTAFRESIAMNHFFRVLETAALRIKRPAAICRLA